MADAITFEQQVAKAAEDAGIKDEPMTSEEEAIPAQTKAEPELTKPVVAPEATHQDEPKLEEVKKAADAPPPPPTTVPLAVHIRQREKHDREMQALRSQIEVGNQRLGELMKTLNPPPAPIDKNTDPLGAMMQQQETITRELGETREILARRQQEDQNRTQIAAFHNAVAQDEQDFSAQHADLKDAIKYAKDVKFREYTALGLEPNQAAARVQQDAFALASHAFQQGLSPAELVYRMAGALGYKPMSTDAAAGHGGAVRPAEKSQAEQAIEMRAAGAERNKATGGSGAATGALSFAELAAMDNDEFIKMTAGKNWAKLAGG